MRSEPESIRNISLHVLQTILYKKTSKTPQPNIHGLNERFDHVCYYNSNKNYNSDQVSEFDALLAIGASQEIVIKSYESVFSELQEFYTKNKGWLFGFLSYDLKNSIEDLSSQNHDGHRFPLLHFFSPKVVILIKNETIHLQFDDNNISADQAQNIYDLTFSDSAQLSTTDKIEIHNRISKEEYINTFNKIKQHIERGDIYEINLCQEFYSENAEIDPPAVFNKLDKTSLAPFSAFCKLNEHYILSASPERFLKKKGNKIISQPMKGTIKRAEDKLKDEELKQQLGNDKKEQNENVMIVDLVRNDLSKIAKRGTVNVDELFGIYSFAQVHQMISTISCELKENISFSDILNATFPMGSMTGAPKVSAMKIIEETESTMRGAYSGALGYIDPSGDFDFNVIIRSILYNSNNKYLSFMTGSAITSKAEAETEYEECLLKAKAMFEVLK
ncbi:MAG: anthranilate synthase component family protein [Bacteroidetes bacterium]|jgi:para-aminobenzoate synthetase component 1|nr:anthranilate synthase component family protein [Bacteroidota bacterium]